MIYTIQNIASVASISTATMRQKIKHLIKEGCLYVEKDASGRITLSKEQAGLVLAKFYPTAYNEWCKNVGIKERLTMIPKGKGAIQKNVQRSGKAYYYIRNLPIKYDEQGGLIYYKGKSYETKEEAERERSRIIQLRDLGAVEQLQVEASRHEKTDHKTLSSIERERNKTFEQVWIEEINRRNISEKTRYGYTRMLSKFNIEVKKTKVKDLTSLLLNDAIAEIYTCIKEVKHILKALLIRLYKNKVILEDLQALLIWSNSQKHRQARRALTIHEVSAIFKSIKDSKYEPFIHLLFKSGLRRGEALALTWEDVKLIEPNQIYLSINKTYSPEGARNTIRSPKTECSIRTFSIYDDELFQMLSTLYKEKCSKWIFTTYGISPYTPFYITKIIKSIGEDIGIYLDAHMLRYTFISHALARGVPATEIARIVGHKNLNMIYTIYAKSIQNTDEILKGVTLY